MPKHRDIISKPLIPTALLLAASCIITGCSLADAGMPRQSFTAEADLQQLQTNLAPFATVDGYYARVNAGATADQLKQARNAFIAARLVTTNINYLTFVRQMTSDKQFLDTATDVLILSMNLAGASLSSAAAKTMLHAISAGVTGAKISIDKNYFFEKTVPALVAAMNAQRASALVPILKGTKAGIADYPFEQAVSDIDAYYYAGTLQSAINTIQSDAAAKQQDAQKQITRLVPLANQDVATKANIAATIHTLKITDPQDAARLWVVLTILDVPGLDPAKTSAPDALKLLQKYITEHTDTPEQIQTAADALERAGISFNKTNVDDPFVGQIR